MHVLPTNIAAPVRKTRKVKPLYTAEDEKKWNGLTTERERCVALWRELLIADEEVERLCTDSEGEYIYDPIAMTIACLNDPEEYENSENDVWQACLKAAKGHLAFRSYMMKVANKHSFSFLLIRQTCDAITL